MKAATDNNLSLAAKGLHTFLLATAKEGQVKTSDLFRSTSRDSLETIHGAIGELIVAGYVHRIKGGLVVLETPDTKVVSIAFQRY